jgi:hypothetical protein
MRIERVWTRTVKEEKQERVMIKLFNGEQVTILFTADMTVLQLKQKIQQKTATDCSEMKLDYAGRPLDKDGLRRI